MSIKTSTTQQAGAGNRVGDLIGTLLLSYLIAAGLIVALVDVAGVWNVLANTRLLDALISGGFIKYHDMQMGFVHGIPEVELYLLSQDPVDWRLMFVVVMLLLIYWLVKAVQFHGLARFCGVAGGFGAHTRALYYGVGLNSLLPYNVGELATAQVLAGQGQRLRNALNALFMLRLFFGFEILFYAIVGLIALGWGTWLTQIFWGLVIFFILFLFMRGTRPSAHDVASQPLWRQLRSALTALSRDPLHLVQWSLLSILAFSLEHVAAYLTVMAFTSDNVILNVDFSLLIMALVGGYIARLIPLTPGGIGQFEWGFAAALYLGGLGFPESATIALLYGLVRYLISALMTLAVRLSYGVETDVGAVLGRFSRAGDDAASNG
ncbi:lysylphosphatidylglycerol synthase transmembrane domain-containing protein [uncultured Thiohalocapsa sp.]|uniref:lysylphosphatidylglycerol synthase transmembrane domain-containing protein n=1 Tax=uncultured Thiohalocapsa sp. TaxID=768990 RepID=UPI0025CF2A75|nr:lysylphosphatidylglycerol synthase transmembrane domain-containing protein [uncultured Thiohalocapsa sp.]